MKFKVLLITAMLVMSSVKGNEEGYNIDEILSNSFIDEVSKKLFNSEIENLSQLIYKIKRCIIGEAEQVNNLDSLLVINAVTNSTYLNDLKEGCVGDNYSILERYYSSLIYKMKFQLNINIKKLLDDHHICQKNSEECYIFFECIDMFMDKDYDVIKSLQNNRDFMELNIGEYLYEMFQKIVIQELKYYKDIHLKLKGEKKVLIDLLETRFTSFVQRLSVKNMEKSSGIDTGKINVADYFGIAVPNHDLFPVTSIRSPPPEMPAYNRRLNLKIFKKEKVETKKEYSSDAHMIQSNPLVDSLRMLRNLDKLELNKLVDKVLSSNIN